MKKLCLLLLFSIALNATSQTEIKSGGGYLEHVCPWGDGYVCAVQKSTKKRYIQKYDKNGVMLWEQTIDPFSYSNEFVASKNGKYAYLVNVGTVTITAEFEAKSTVNALVIYSISESGEVKTFELNYNKYFGNKIGGGLNSVYIEFLGAYDGGLVGVLLKGGREGEPGHAMFTYDGENEPVITTLPFTFTVSEYQSKIKSKPEFYLSGNRLLGMQLTALNDSVIEINTSQVDLMTSEFISQTKCTVKLKSQYTYSYNSQKYFDLRSPSEVSFVEHFYTDIKHNVVYNYLTLGGIFEYHVYNDRLFAFANWSGSRPTNLPVTTNVLGFLSFEIDLEKDSDLRDSGVTYTPLIGDPDKGKALGSAYLPSSKGVMHVITYESGAYYYINNELKGKLDVTGIPARLAIIYALGKEDGFTINVPNPTPMFTIYRDEDKFFIEERTKYNTMYHTTKAMRVSESMH